MSRYIKTGEEIHDIANGTLPSRAYSIWKTKWISLDELEKQIREEEKRIEKENELHCYSVLKGINIIKDLIKNMK